MRARSLAQARTRLHGPVRSPQRCLDFTALVWSEHTSALLSALFLADAIRRAQWQAPLRGHLVYIEGLLQERDWLAGRRLSLADFAAENVLQRINKDLVPDPLAGVPRVDGVAVVKVSGTPEEMGIQHGTFLKEAVHYNMHRTLHGVGLVATIESGKWYPNELAMAWKAQEKYIPERFIREIDAMSDAAGAGGVGWPPGPPPSPPALEAIERADLVLLGPGSLFTSVLPHLAIPQLAEALVASDALRVYVCNVMTQPGETDGFDAADHAERVLEAVPGGLDAVVVHDGPLDTAALASYRAQGQEPVAPARARLDALGLRAVVADIAQDGAMVRHDPVALADVLLALAAETVRV